MNNISPDQVAGLFTGATPVQIVILILLGASVFGLIILIVVNLIKLYIAPLSQEIDASKTDKELLQKIDRELVKISSRLWSKEDIEERIHNAINQHVIDCPCLKTQKGK